MEHQNSETSIISTVNSYYSICFPAGTSAISGRRKTNGNTHECPAFPPDLFAFCGSLLQASGAYSLLCPGDVKFPEQMQSCNISQDDLDLAIQAGAEWKSAEHAYKAPQYVRDLWNELSSNRNEKVYNPASKPIPKWWRLAFLMYVASDEACAGVGRHGRPENWVDSVVSLKEQEGRHKPQSLGSSPSSNLQVSQFSPASISAAFNRDIACVQPKVRTPGVGCTLRTLSNHLALLPSQGPIKANWIRPPQHLGEPDRVGLNVLNIPYPFKIKPEWFRAELPATPDRFSKWGWFHIEQGWIENTSAWRENFCEFVYQLVKQASKHDHVHAISFPEYALSWEVFQTLSDFICGKAESDADFKSIEILVSGASNNCAGESGNIVLSANFYTEKTKGKDARTYIVTSRPKHHRWRIDSYQAKTYGLSKTLTLDRVWWEKIPIPRREVHFNVFREKNAFTTLICEDLARSDPCHEIIRSVGPNLVFVMLMDGPQLPHRWPSRYATGLADDPGSGVLTFTSRALVEASNAGRSDPNWSVALWKGENDEPISLQCPPDKQAILLRFKVNPIEDATLDGRSDANYSWSLRLNENNHDAKADPASAPEYGNKAGTLIDISSNHEGLLSKLGIL